MKKTRVKIWVASILGMVLTGSVALAADFTPNDTYYFTQGSLNFRYRTLEDLWWSKLLTLEAAWDLTRGAGSLVAVVDSGVYAEHLDLQGNIRSNAIEMSGVSGVDDDGNGYIDDIHGWDFVSNDNNPADAYGHGTHIAGIIGALGGNSRGIIGVAPESSILPVRVLDGQGNGTWNNVAAGVRYATDAGARVINLSLGQDQEEMSVEEISTIQEAIHYASNQGSIVVVAAGNSGGDVDDQVPALFDETISVGSLRHGFDTLYGSGEVSRANFSSQGSALDFVAPGVDIYSLAVSSSIYVGYRRLAEEGAFYSVTSGTSMSTAMVSGTIALMLSLDPLATFETIYRRLRYSSIDMGEDGFDAFYGYGLIDPYKALTQDYYDNGAVKTQWAPDTDQGEAVRYEYSYVSPSSDKVRERKIFIDEELQALETYTYNSRDRVSREVRIENDEQGRTETTREWTSFSYNAQGRVKAYVLTERSRYGADKKSAFFYGYSYDISGKVKGFRRQDRDAGGNVTGSSIYSQLVYVGSQLQSYQRVDRDSSGVLLRTLQVTDPDPAWLDSNSVVTSLDSGFEGEVSAQSLSFREDGYWEMKQQKNEERRGSVPYDLAREAHSLGV